MQLLEDRVKEKVADLLAKFRIEVVFIVISIFTALLSLALFIKVSQFKTQEPADVAFEAAVTEPLAKKTIYVDISGAVENPDVYEVSEGARLRDVLILANGLSKEADRLFFQRSFNLARIVQDQEKIYIPTENEVEEGLVEQSVKGSAASLATSSESAGNLINVNTASESQLDSLSGVGQVTAKKIIDNRPYGTVDELLSKKIVGKKTFDKIKDQLVAQ